MPVDLKPAEKAKGSREGASSDRLTTTVGRVTLKNPLIAGSAEHMIDAEGVRRALQSGAGAVVVKSTNKSMAARDQLTARGIYGAG